MARFSRDMSVHIGYGDIRVALVAEGESWSPDVARDMVNRVGEIWRNTLEGLWEVGLVGNNNDDDDEDDEDYIPTPEKELIDPFTVFLTDESGDNG